MHAAAARRGRALHRRAPAVIMSAQQTVEPFAALSGGLARLGIDADDAQRRQLIDFVLLLAKWNRVFNLTAVKDPAQMVIRHLLDSLAVLPYIRGTRVLDVGSGAGLPGIPLAIVKPEWSYTLLDKQGKKTRFMLQAAADLGLGQVEVVQGAVETFTPDNPFDTVVARAFASLYHMVDSCGRLCAPDGRLLAMKGKPSPRELSALPPGYRCLEEVQLQVPGLNAARSLVVVAPVAP